MYHIDQKSEAVREVQTYLRELSQLYGEIPPISIDGIYGEETREAIRAFQRMTGLLVTGETDYETFERLYGAYAPIREERIGESELIPAVIFPLRMGDSGSHVRILQSVLGEVLGIRLPSDGFYGRTTEEGVKAAEARYLFPPTGSVTRALWQKLAADYRAAVSEKIPN